uniref:AAA_8 domain-containing protein n=1 Tax=Panagrellus redivivus TaxID=6233 RepID=A0A7E4VHP1_PANRE
MIIAGPKGGGRQDLANTLSAVSKSLSQMEVQISSKSYQYMKMFPPFNHFNDINYFSLIDLLERNADLEPFSLPAFPQLETVTRVSSLEKVEPEKPLSYFVLNVLHNIAFIFERLASIVSKIL